jgi:hypothetical protein
MNTWLADRSPNALTLAISGPDQQLGIQLLRLLRCLCHHPVMLAELTPGSYRMLRLSLRLLLDQQRWNGHEATFARVGLPWATLLWKRRTHRRSLWSQSNTLPLGDVPVVIPDWITANTSGILFVDCKMRTGGDNVPLDLSEPEANQYDRDHGSWTNALYVASTRRV